LNFQTLCLEYVWRYVWRLNFQTCFARIKKVKKPQFVNNQIYHIYNRGVEKRTTFIENRDYLRFIHDLFEFNNNLNVSSSNIRFSLRKPSQVNEVVLSQCLECLEVEPPNIERKSRKLLVEILAFCLMPNHFHLLLKQKLEGGIVKFMQRLGTGYTLYFNQKNERVGPLFQGRFKAVLIENNRHFKYLPHYIHLNPLDLKSPKWREGKIKNTAVVTKFLENYRWSSFKDYIGNKNFPSVTQRGVILSLFGGPKGYQNSVKDWLGEMDLEDIREVILE